MYIVRPVGAKLVWSKKEKEHLQQASEVLKSCFQLMEHYNYSKFCISEDEKIVIDKIISQFDFGLVGIDFIIGDSGQLIFNEIEDVVGSRMLYKTSDINIVERYLQYIMKKLTK